MNKKYFVISDIHGHYDALFTALKASKYDELNPSHTLIVLGDLFDRGTQSKEVLEYLYPLSLNGRTYMITGNHDLFVRDLLSGKYDRVQFNIEHNGFQFTLESLVGRLLPKDFDVEAVSDEIALKYPYLLEWLQGFLPYLELGDYIFVHGGVNDTQGDWRLNSLRDLVWSSEMKQKRIEGKTVVAGHHRTATIRRPNSDYELLFKSHPEAFDIFYDEGKIMIDGFVEISHRINVLILEDII
jgi:serine/threonine protein phosphatase 1